MSNKKLWGGRFSTSTDSVVEAFSASVNLDKRLAHHDILGSIAHARMLADVGVLSNDEANAIADGLNEIDKEISAGDFQWLESLEDVHMNIEARLTEKIGDVGKKLHTARSRNDQVATDVRLYLRDAIDDIDAQMRQLGYAFLELAERHTNDIMPGFTHLQVAQPVTLGHHVLAWFEMLNRDCQRLRECRRRVNVSPLGCAALAGTSFAIDRQHTADALGFESVSLNSLDSVSDRDFIMEFISHSTIAMLHLSRVCEELVLWSSDQFGFVDLGDAFCTGSSIMPQKKNPDVGELVRGKCARVHGHLNTIMMLMKAQPLAYNRDNQEDKAPLFDTIDTLMDCLIVMTAMLPQSKFNTVRLRAAAAKGYSTATDLADYLVRKGVAFRDAHEAVGNAVQWAIANDRDLADVDLATLKRFSPRIDDDVYAVLTLEGSVQARDHIGGTAPAQVRHAIAKARERLDNET